ncbi:hypothetical protein HK096_003229 [Nowakowskiella sp. JEL0078]|nr:hypothetical protein HK096_003229 [Nowakowskiella sp. JEL0078]
MAFRKTNVDIEEEEFLDASDSRSYEELEALLNARTADVRNKLSMGNVAAAVLRSIEDPPFGRDFQDLKDRNAQAVIEALQAAKLSDIPSIVKSLSSEQSDILMKFVYRGMASPDQFNSAILLIWHEKYKIFEEAGLGSIVRVLTDRQTV